MKNESHADDISNNKNTNTLRRHRLVSSTEPNRAISTDTSNLSSSYVQRTQRKKTSRSIISLSWQRLVVKFLTLTRTSQFLVVIIVISMALLLSPTIHLMTSSSSSSTPTIWTVDDYSEIRTEAQAHTNRRRKKSSINNTERKNNHIYETFLNDHDGDKPPPPPPKFDYNQFLKRFSHRKTFLSREPRVVKLTDQNHSFHFVIAPGSAADNDELFNPEEWGSRELKHSFVELRVKNPKIQSQAESLDKGDCQPVASSWQLGHNHVCNKIHEESGGWQQLYLFPTELKGIDPETMQWGIQIIKNNLTNPGRDQREQMRLVNKGAFRHVWMIRDHDGVTKRAMKTLRSLQSKEKKFDLRNFDRHRRDAIAFEQLQKSKLVVDIYGYCSNTAIFDFADGGDLTRIYDKGMPKPSKLDILRIAYNVSLSIHDAHHFDEVGRPTMAHTDIKTDQFIYQNGHYKLSDFNRVRFLMWNKTVHKWNQLSDGQCGFDVGKNGGEYRSPEEYSYKKETEKVDVYSLGNVLYFLLAGIDPWKNVSLKDVYRFVKAGQRPKIPGHMRNSTGVYERCMIRAMENAWIHSPEKRPSALQVANIIKEGINILSS